MKNIKRRIFIGVLTLTLTAMPIAKSFADTDAIEFENISSEGKATLSAYDYYETDAVRYEGASRYDTSIESAEAYMKANPNTDTVLIASGENYADALSGTPLAETHKAPLILVRANSVPDGVSEFLYKHKIKHFIVIGGKGTVSDKVVNEMRDYINIEQLKVYKVDVIKDIQALEYLNDQEKTNWINRAKGSNDKSYIDKTLQDAKNHDERIRKQIEALKPIKEQMKNDIRVLPELTQSEKDAYNKEIDKARSQEELDTIWKKAKANSDKKVQDKELNEYRQSVKNSVKQLNYLTEQSQANYQKRLDNAKTKQEIDQIKQQAISENEQRKAEALKEVENLKKKNIATLMDNEINRILEVQGTLPREKDIVAQKMGNLTDTIFFNEVKVMDDNNIGIKLKDGTYRKVIVGGIKAIPGYEKELNKFLKENISASKVAIEKINKIKGNDVTCEIWSADSDVGGTAVAMGWALVDRNYEFIGDNLLNSSEYRATYIQWEETAKKYKRGYWGLATARTSGTVDEIIEDEIIEEEQ